MNLLKLKKYEFYDILLTNYKFLILRKIYFTLGDIIESKKEKGN